MKAECVRRNWLANAVEVSLAVVKESCSVSDKQLQVENLRAIDVRIINFRNDAASSSKPDFARQRPRGSNTTLVCSGPVRQCAWPAKSRIFLHLERHCRVNFLCRGLLSQNKPMPRFMGERSFRKPSSRAGSKQTHPRG